jgi:hypothetical protein
MDCIQKIALFGKRPSPYYGKTNSNKQRETTINHYFDLKVSQYGKLKNFESFFKFSQKSHQAL